MADVGISKDMETLWEQSQPVEQPSPQEEENLNNIWESAEPATKEFTAEDLKGATNVSEMPAASMQTVGGIVGGIAGIPGGPVGMLGGAALGGAAGKAWEDVYNQLFNPEKASKTAMTAYVNILQAGGEEAAYEVAGQVVTKVGSKAYHIFKPKRAGGIDELQKTFAQYGGTFTAAESTESFLTQSLDSLVRGSLSAKGIMHAADDVNNAALKLWQDDLSNQIASTAAKNMPDGVFGDLVQSTLKGGKEAFKVRTNELYSSFDDLVITRIEKDLVKKKVSSEILDAKGMPITKDVISQVTKEIRPVDVRPIKQEAAKLAERLARISNIGKSEFGGKTIDDILNLDDALRFSDAQNLRSTLLDISRGLGKDPTEAKLAGSINNFASKMTDAMDTAAKSQGDDIFKAYQIIKKSTEEGFKSFNDKIIVSMLKDDTASSKIGEMIYKQGNVDQIVSFKKALNSAAKYDKTIDVKQVWQQTQQKYLESFLHNITKDVEMTAGEKLTEFQVKSGTASAAKLAKILQEPKSINTMNEMLGKEQRQLIYDFAQAAGITQQKSVAGLSMVIQLTQAGAVMGALSGRAGAAQMAATILIPTTILAKMMTNPTTVKLMTSAAKTSVSANQAAKIAAKLVIAYENEKRKEEGKKTPAEEIINIGEKALKAL